MCLAVPAKGLEIHGKKTVVSSRGWTREVDARRLRAKAGDYLLVQGGVAMMRMDRKEAEGILATSDEIEAAVNA